MKSLLLLGERAKMGQVVSTVSLEDQTKTNGHGRYVHFRSGGSEVRGSGIERAKLVEGCVCSELRGSDQNKWL